MKQKLPVIFLFITVMLDSMGIGLIMPVMSELIIELDGGNISQAAIWGGILAAIFSVMQFLCGPLVGSISDPYGCRPVLLILLAVMAVNYLIKGLAHSMCLLVLARIVGEITSAIQSSFNAYMADISKPNQKARILV